MNKKVLSLFLSATILLNSLVFMEKSFANEIVDFKIDADVVEQQSIVLKDLIRQTSGSYKEKDILTFIIEINDEVMKSEYSLDVPDISAVRTDSGLRAQLEYAKKSQEKLLDKIEDLGADFEVVEKYDTALNALAIKTSLKSAKEIANLKEVASIEVNRIIPAPNLNISSLYRTKDASSNGMIKAEDAWRKNFTGKGQFIAIIDSGADPLHEVFTNFDKTELKIKNEQEMRTFMSSRNLTSGKYFNDKIPFGFNYADRNNVIKGSNAHGMHVSGIF